MKEVLDKLLDTSSIQDETIRYNAILRWFYDHIIPLQNVQSVPEFEIQRATEDLERHIRTNAVRGMIEPLAGSAFIEEEVSRIDGDAWDVSMSTYRHTMYVLKLEE